jgi:hypothetical protein
MAGISDPHRTNPYDRPSLRAIAKQSNATTKSLDCVVALLLAMTVLIVLKRHADIHYVAAFLCTH